MVLTTIWLHSLKLIKLSGFCPFNLQSGFQLIGGKPIICHLNENSNFQEKLILLNFKPCFYCFRNVVLSYSYSGFFHKKSFRAKNRTEKCDSIKLDNTSSILMLFSSMSFPFFLRWKKQGENCERNFIPCRVILKRIIGWASFYSVKR